MRRMPRCVGLYDQGHRQCDGDRRGASDLERMPCVYRDRCAAFRLQMRASGRPREFFVTNKVVDGVEYSFALEERAFHDGLTETIVRHGIVNGHPARSVPAPLKERPHVLARQRQRMAIARLKQKPTKKAMKRLAAAQRAKNKNAFAEALDVARWLVKVLSERMRMSVAAAPDEAPHGRLYLVDRSETSGYQALYARVRNKRIPLLNFMLKRQKLEVRLATSISAVEAAASKADVALLAPSVVEDGSFKTRFRDVDKERAHVIATLVAKLFGDAVA